MIKSAEVLEILEVNKARVMLYKHKKCHGCGSCNKNMHPGSIFIAENPVRSKEGEIVDVDVKKAFSITEFSIAYILPIASFFIGLFIGSLIFTDKEGGAISVVIAFILLIISIIINVIYRKNYHPKYSVSIVKRIVPTEHRLK